MASMRIGVTKNNRTVLSQVSTADLQKRVDTARPRDAHKIRAELAKRS